MKRTLVIVGTFIVLSLSEASVAYSGLFFNVTPTGSGLAITTTIPNHTYPAAGIKLKTSGASITGGCTRAGNGYCLFPVSDTSAAVISVSGANGNLSAILCLNGQGPLSCQNYSTAMTGIPRFAYIGSYSDTTAVTKCSINVATGALSNCAGTGYGLDVPSSIAFNAAGTFAYVSNYGASTVTLCTVNISTGELSGCATTGSTFEDPTSIAINPAGTLLYTTNYSNGNISICSINQSTGALFNCSSSNIAPSDSIQGITFNAMGTLAYIGSYSTNVIRKCNVNAVTGALSGCATTGSGFSDPAWIALNPAGTMAYVTNYTSNSISICSVNGVTGALSSCTNYPFPELSGPDSIAINKTGTFAYITNYDGTSVVQCAINTSNGLITGCTATTGFVSPTGIGLYY